MTDTHLTMLVLKTDGTRTEHSVLPDDLEKFQKAVGGYIEIVPRFKAITIDGVRRQCIAFCNEDGIALRLAPNREASSIWGFGVLRGNVAVLYGDQKLMAQL